MNKTTRSWLIAILVSSVLLRIGVAFYLGDVVDAPPLLTDQRSYDALGARLATSHGFTFDREWYPFTPPDAPTAHWSFLESLLVAGVYVVAGVHPLAARLMHAVLGGILLPWLTYRLARRMFRGQMGEALPLLSAALSAIYFYFVLYAATIMTETLYVAALLWSLERALAANERLRLSARANLGLNFSLGLSLGIATLFRQSILPWVVVLFAWLLWIGYRQGVLRHALITVVTSTIVLILCILPFTIRNYRVYDQFLLLNSNAGYALYSAQHPMHGTSFQEFAAAPLPQDLAGEGLNEAQWDRELMRRGIGFVLAEPGRYLLLSLSRIPDYFEFWPTRDTTLLNNIGRTGSFGLFLPFMLYGIWLALRQAGPGRSGRSWVEFSTTPLALVLLFVVFYSLMHVFTWAMPRYRLPVDAVSLIFAAMAIAELWARMRARLGARTGVPVRERQA
jgi:hypothetical protein